MTVCKSEQRLIRPCAKWKINEKVSKTKNKKKNRFRNNYTKNVGQVSWGGTVEYTDFPTTTVLDMTLNNMMVKFQLWGMLSTPSLLSLWSGVIAPDRVLFMGQIEPNYILMQS